MGVHNFKCLICGREDKATSGVKYFKLPQTIKRRERWLNVIQKLHLLDKKISQDIRVCEKHFSKEMYSRHNTRLKFSATPDLYISQNSTDNLEGNIYQNISKENLEAQLKVNETFDPRIYYEDTQMEEVLGESYDIQGTDLFDVTLENLDGNEPRSDVTLGAEASSTNPQWTKIMYRETAEMNTEVLNHDEFKFVKDQTANDKQPNSDCQRLPENTIITKLPTTTSIPVERTYRNNQLVHKLPDAVANLSEAPMPMPPVNSEKTSTGPTRYQMSIVDQKRIERDCKEIECLEAVVKYTTHMQSIARQRGNLDSILQANSHLLILLDKVIYEWFRRAQKRIEIGVLADELFILKALESKQIFCIQNFNPDQEWLTTFKKKFNITELDLRMLHIENDNFPLSVDIIDIVLDVLKSNPVAECFSDTTLQNGAVSISSNNIVMTTQNEMIDNTIVATAAAVVKNKNYHEIDEDTDMELQLSISNDEQAKLHLKPLEEYVLLKDNFRAMGLISQLMDIFSSDIKKEQTCNSLNK